MELTAVIQYILTSVQSFGSQYYHYKFLMTILGLAGVLFCELTWVHGEAWGGLKITAGKTVNSLTVTLSTKLCVTFCFFQPESYFRGVQLKFSGRGAGVVTPSFKTPSPNTNNFCLYPPRISRCFWKDSLTTPHPHHPTSTSFTVTPLPIHHTCSPINILIVHLLETISAHFRHCEPKPA